MSANHNSIRVFEHTEEIWNSRLGGMSLPGSGERVKHWNTVNKLQEKIDNESTAALHERTSMGKSKVLQAGLPGISGLVCKEKHQRQQQAQAADMVFVLASTLQEADSLTVIGEKMSEILLGIGVPVVARGCKKRDEMLQPALRGVTLSAAEEVEEFCCELDIECVFPGLQKLMIMDALFTPVAGLVVQNIG